MSLCASGMSFRAADRSVFTAGLCFVCVGESFVCVGDCFVGVCEYLRVLLRPFVSLEIVDKAEFHFALPAFKFFLSDVSDLVPVQVGRSFETLVAVRAGVRLLFLLAGLLLAGLLLLLFLLAGLLLFLAGYLASCFFGGEFLFRWPFAPAIFIGSSPPFF